VLDILEDHLGVLWVATYGGGLDRFDPERNEFSHFRHRDGDPASLGDDKVYCLHEDRQGTLWIGTNSGGLNRFDRRSGRFAVYTTEDGLPNNVIFGILEDDDGCLWLSTNRGLARFDPRLNSFRSYSSRDGLAGNEFLPLAYFKNSSGNMFFGGTGGLTSFRPQQMSNDTSVPPVVITTVTAPNSNRVLDGQNMKSSGLRLGPGDSLVTIAFAALNYSDPTQNQFAYRLDPLTTDWVPLGTRHEITLTDLRPGSYRLRVKGCNRDLAWNENGASLAIVIQPPFWQTWWFRLLVTVGLALIALLVVWVRHRLLSWKRIAAPPDLEAICSQHNISKREEEVLRLVIQGKSNSQIENELFISIKTVKTHLYNLYRKCGVNNRLELINFLQGKKPGNGS
jgi:DNA-binding CsgD family transcriptional regulator